MNALMNRQLWRLRSSDQTGLSMIEVIVAMMVFAIIALGVAYSILTTLHTSKEGKGREVALNLAAQEIDAARAITDIFAVQSIAPRTTTVPGDSTVYTVTRSVDWVTSTGSDADCGSGGGSLLYKEVNVTVTWAGMISGNPVRSDTIIAPSSTINDPSLGTILVSVHNAAGAGVPGVAITTSPSVGVTPPVTDSQGCSFILKVAPGTYNVSALLSGYIDNTQDTTPTTAQPLSVTAGSTVTASFSYDQAGTVQVSYAANYAPTTRPNLPSNLTTTFSSNLGGLDSVPRSAGTFTGTKGTYSLFPFVSYTNVAAGTELVATTTSPGCLNVDPTNWPVGTTNPPPPAIATFPPGGSTSVNVSMGVLTVKTGGSTAYITATAAATSPVGSGDPGCFATPLASYTFGPITPTSGNVLIALPYGSYTLKAGTSSGSQAAVTAANIILATGIAGIVNSSTGVVTLDPRS